MPAYRHSFRASPPLVRRARSSQLAGSLPSSSTTRTRAASRPSSTGSSLEMDSTGPSLLSVHQILTDAIAPPKSRVTSMPRLTTTSTTVYSLSSSSGLSVVSSPSGTPTRRHPSTHVATLTTWPPTRSQPTIDRHGSSILFPPLSIALMSGGGAIILLAVFIAFHRLRAASGKRLEAEVSSRDSSIFGDLKFKREHEWVEIKDSSASSGWSQSHIPTDTRAELGHGAMPRPLGNPRLPMVELNEIDLSSNSWKVMRNEPRIKRDPQQTAGLAGVGVLGRRNDTATGSTNSQFSKVYPVGIAARSLRVKDQIGTSMVSAEPVSQGNKTSSVWSTSPESKYEAEINTASRSKIVSLASLTLKLSPRNSMNYFADLRPEITIPTCKPVRPLTLKRSATIDQHLGNLSDLRGDCSASCSNLPHHLHFGDQSGLMREDTPPYSLKKSPSVATEHQKGISTDASSSRPSSSAHRSRYTPSSGRFQVPVSVHDSQRDSVEPGTSSLEFPLPPPIRAFSAIAASTSLPYAHAKAKNDDRERRASVRASYASDSPARGLESLGDMMMNDYYVSDGGDTSGLEDLPVSTSAKRISRRKHQMSVVAPMSSNRKSRTLDLSENRTKPSQSAVFTRHIMSPAVSVPQITVTATPSSEEIKHLNRRLSRVKRSEMKPSASTPTGASFRPGRPFPSTSTPHVAAGVFPEIFSKEGSPPGDDWPSLSQMAMERVQPQYHSATNSIYGLYNGAEGDLTGHRFPSSVRTPTLGRMRSDSKSGRTSLARATRQDNTTLSTIYSGYGLSQNDEDISASFVREIGDSLGRIGRI